MATEIKRLIALTGGMLTWKDFAILRKSSCSLLLLLLTTSNLEQCVSTPYPVLLRRLYRRKVSLIGFLLDRDSLTEWRYVTPFRNEEFLPILFTKGQRSFSIPAIGR